MAAKLAVANPRQTAQEDFFIIQCASTQLNSGVTPVTPEQVTTPSRIVYERQSQPDVIV